MAAVSDRHWRMLIRCISPTIVVWTEMVWAHAISGASSNECEKLIGFSPEEHPIVAQLGGCDPDLLARAAVICARRGYDEVNLNCGCPAGDQGAVRSIYGARMMLQPQLTAECCLAMRSALDAAGFLNVPLSVKCRNGVDERDSFDELLSFVQGVSRAGVRHVIIHARKADLTLNAARNREVPPLRPEWGVRLCHAMPCLQVTLNGGIRSIDEASSWCAKGAHGAMIGRRANTEPYLFAAWTDNADGSDPTTTPPRSRREVLDMYLEYTRVAQKANWGGGHPETLSRQLIGPLFGLFHNTPYGPRWRRALTALFGRRDDLRTIGAADLVRRCVDACAIPEAFLTARPATNETATAHDTSSAPWHRSDLGEMSLVIGNAPCAFSPPPSPPPSPPQPSAACLFAEPPDELIAIIGYTLLNANAPTSALCLCRTSKALRARHRGLWDAVCSRRLQWRPPTPRTVPYSAAPPPPPPNRRSP